jgi:hypothetical protein
VIAGQKTYRPLSRCGVTFSRRRSHPAGGKGDLADLGEGESVRFEGGVEHPPTFAVVKFDGEEPDGEPENFLTFQPDSGVVRGL